jgi:acyl dehydratase
MTRPPRAVRAGDVLEPRNIGPVTQTDVVRFAGAGGDFNPLHHDPDFARAAGFERPIAMGQLQAGLLAAWVTDTFGVEHLRELTVRFTAPVPLGSVLVLAGTVAGVDDVDEVGGVDGATGSVARLDLVARVGDVDVIRGAAIVRVSEG